MGSDVMKRKNRGYVVVCTIMMWGGGCETRQMAFRNKAGISKNKNIKYQRTKKSNKKKSEVASTTLT